MESASKKPTELTRLSWQEGFDEVQPQSARSERLDSLDLARGIAITLMVISHTIKGLLMFEQMPAWGIMPVHTITKFSSSLFFLVFGISLAIFIGPQTKTSGWLKKRNKLLKRGLLIMVWYKLLTVVQMFQTYPQEAIVETLLFQRFPDFVEVLGFYAIFLLWFPFVLRGWRELDGWTKATIVAALAVGGHWLNTHFDFWGWNGIKTLLVENEADFTFGQFQRGAMVLGGWMLGEAYIRWGNDPERDNRFAALLLMLSLICGAYFMGRGQEQMTTMLTAIGRNFGKHPPSVVFLSFSMGGAFAILALCFWMKSLPSLLAPITMIGRRPMFSFCFHIFVVFVCYRYLLNLHHNTTYNVAWQLTLLLLGVTAMLVWFLENLKKKKKRK